MIKRISSLIIAILILCSVSVVGINAATTPTVRQTDVLLPDVRIELSGKVDKSDITLAKLMGKKLTVENAYPSSRAKNKAVYVLVDTSNSMSKDALNRLKPALIKFAQSFSNDDKFVLMTFGGKVKTLLKGGESDKTIKSKISSITCKENSTKFYEALNSAISKSKEVDKVRKYAIVISDGVNHSDGQGSSSEVGENSKTRELPLYGLCVKTSSSTQGSMSSFGGICRKAGGEMKTCTAGNITKNFKSLQGVINDSTIVEFTSPYKITGGNRKVTLTINGNNISQPVDAKAAEDTVAPNAGVSYDAELNAIVVTYTEEMLRAGKIENYHVFNSNGKEVPVKTVEYQDNKAVVSLNEEPYSGTYNLVLSNEIVDRTDNENSLTQLEYSVEIKDKSMLLTVLKIVGIVMIPVLFLLAIFFILLFMKKKKNVTKIKDIFVAQETVVENEQVHIQQPQGMKIKIYIHGKNGDMHNMDYNLVGSMFLGRDSQFCDVTIDDDRLSAQHFVVEQVESGLAVTDLGSTNGTTVNGVPILSRTFIKPGDKIYAGMTIVTIMY